MAKKSRSVEEREAQARLLRAISPALFQEVFSIAPVQRYQWEEMLKIPCGRGRETIDLFACGVALARVCSRRVELMKTTPDMAAKKMEKLQEEIESLRNRNVQLRSENEITAKARLPKAVILDRLEAMATIIRGLGDRFARKTRLTGDEAQRMLNHALDQYEKRLADLKNL